MDWKSINFDWNRARAFLVTAEEGSFSAAAKALKVTQSTLGRQVAGLEQELGVTLFQRVGKGIEITASGLKLIEYVKEMADAANRFSLAASGQASGIEGTVVITASEAFSVFLLPPLLKELRELEPGIKIEIVATNLSSDLRRREADIAIRNFKPKHPDLIAQKVKDTKAYLYAAKDYLKRSGPFKRKSDLSKGDFIGFSDNTKYIEGLNQLGLSLTEENFPYISENHIAHWSLIKNGAGIGVMPEKVGEEEPAVERVLKSIPPFPVETWIVSHRELRTSRRIRFVFDFLVKAFGDS
ncbi:LysR family transcriptional regulator [Halobacteriovorax marinus]|uniref:LysR family transcriptional regulator n=1 Tax=Halobacteriovorax marinus TaxID=97084 RepID=A0A1Y5F542_9BACT|nr:LysR family transcriptional regulator [Halobacteriovorax marinus]